MLALCGTILLLRFGDFGSFFRFLSPLLSLCVYCGTLEAAFLNWDDTIDRDSLNMSQTSCENGRQIDGDPLWPPLLKRTD